MASRSARQTIKRLHAVRNRYGGTAAEEKRQLLEDLAHLDARAASDLKALHAALSFLCAYPDDANVHALATAGLRAFGARVAALGAQQRRRLNETGIAGTTLHYPFSCEVAAWLASRYPGVASIDWDAIDDTSRLDELLQHLLHHAESDFYDSGRVSTEEWVRIAAAGQAGTDFDWLMAELADRRLHSRYWVSLYNAAEIPIACAPGDAALSRTHNRLPVADTWMRATPMQGRVARAALEVARPLGSLRLLGPADGERLLDVAMASLAMRHRETVHFNYANPAEVWLADVGRGVSIAATGLLPDHRYPLECTMGFLILANGVPVGYGGSSMLFRQVNTGINIFEEYRGSEAAWLWVQVMRVFHALSGCTRFIANPYQVGSENPEALKSGAFWFYYRLGYRPVDADVRRLARSEFSTVAAEPGYRTPLPVLRQLATSDMHLLLPGGRQADLFDERWIEYSSLIATKQLAETGLGPRRRAEAAIARTLATELGMGAMAGWTPWERRWFLRLAPIVSALGPGAWPARDRKALVALLRAKGGDRERDFVQQFSRHARLFEALKKACRNLARAH